MTEREAKQLNQLVLAFVGDSVFTLFVRERLAVTHDSKAGALHKIASDIVKATAQAKFLDLLEPEFTDEERDIARRAKNSHNNTKAKNASVHDYKKATEFEAVIGYLHLTGQEERKNYMMEKSYNAAIGEKNE